ncbi:MAG: hypothetical protein AAFU03_00155 [Bacteroidota bacterium]
MRNLLTLCFFLLFAVAGLTAQGSTNEEFTPSYRMGDGFQLRDLVHGLSLTHEQIATLKDYFTATNDARKMELQDTEDRYEQNAIYIRYQEIRDTKIRTMLTPEQLTLFEAFVLERQQGDREQEELPIESGGGR